MVKLANNFWFQFGWDCRTMLELYELQPLELPVRTLELGNIDERLIEPLARVAGPGCFVAVREDSGHTVAIGTTENLKLLRGAPFNQLHRNAALICELYGELFYRLSPGALEELRGIHMQRLQLERIKHKIAILYPSLRKWPGSDDYDLKLKGDVQLRLKHDRKQVIGLPTK